MSKVIYPDDGIYRYCSNSAENCLSNLSTAISKCSFDVPSDFSYKGFLDGLSSTLNDYKNEFDSINSTLRDVTISYEKLSSDLVAEVKKIESNEIIERDRMIS